MRRGNRDLVESLTGLLVKFKNQIIITRQPFSELTNQLFYESTNQQLNEQCTTSSSSYLFFPDYSSGFSYFYGL